MKITKTWFKKEIEITPQELGDLDKSYYQLSELTHLFPSVDIFEFIKSLNH
jgi:hypothetical protein